MKGALRLDGDGLLALEPGSTPWRVAEGAVEVYLAGPERRRLVATVPRGGHVFPLPPGSAARLVLAASAPAMLRPDGAELSQSARAWAALHGGLDALPERADRLIAAVQGWTEALDARFAAEAEAEDRRTLARLALHAGAEHGEDAATAELRWLLGPRGEALPAGALADAGAEALPARLAPFGLRVQAITLAPDWARHDAGPLLLRTTEGGWRAARWRGRFYRLRDGSAITASSAAGFDRRAFILRPPFAPPPRGLAGLLRFVAPDLLRDWRPQLAAALGLALAGLAAPVVTGLLFDAFVPAGERGLILAAGAALVAVALFAALLGAVQGLAQARADGRTALRFAAAISDHVLRLPPAFFRTLSASDLNQRIEGLEAMRALGLRVAVTGLATALFAIGYFALLFGYDAALALTGLGLTCVYALAVLASRLAQMPPLRRAAELDGKLAGLTYELLEALPKLRTAAAEPRMLARWTALYARERDATARAERFGNGFAAFAGGYDVLVPMALFATAALLRVPEIGAGTFVAFLTAFGLFEAAFIGLAAQLLALYAAQPLAERATTVLAAAPETRPGGADPGRLSGAIDISGLRFGYDPAASPLLDGIDLRIAAGEHVAIVGGSGSGKSTLLRLLLGFETPQAGSIAYDGQELPHLDLARVRRQIGAVLQNSLLFSGSIFENIRGASDAGLERCLEAARLAGLEPDLALMGMGIHTPITEGGGTFSGGQRQRILIARAIAARPRILFLDEATSALDNATQAVVAATLDALDATRITIAHRLSTVRRADRIAVLKAGRLVEIGTFSDLMARDGAFAALARRQLLKD